MGRIVGVLMERIIISILDYTAVGVPVAGVYSSRLMKAIFSWDKVFIELPAQANVQLETIGFQEPPFPHLGSLPCRCQ